MIRETCSCGAHFETDDMRLLTSGPEWNTHGRRLLTEWRADHKCVEPVTLAELTDSGPGLADVIDAIDRVAAGNGLLAELAMAYVKAQP